MLMLVLMTAAACSSDPGGQPPLAPLFELSLTPETPVPGQDVTVVLANLSGSAVGYNLCTSTLVRDEGGQLVEQPSDRVCTMELRSLQPGERDGFTLVMPETLPRGIYRFRTRLVHGEGEDGPASVDSHLFLVSAPASNP
ncbi:MAG: hypothetical protein LBG44_06495 [Gemmatimonadota bacterium]|nr:hypothetical protein [Gemmatimonadota bacterium]